MYTPATGQLYHESFLNQSFLGETTRNIQKIWLLYLLFINLVTIFFKYYHKGKKKKKKKNKTEKHLETSKQTL